MAILDPHRARRKNSRQPPASRQTAFPPVTLASIKLKLDAARAGLAYPTLSTLFCRSHFFAQMFAKY